MGNTLILTESKYIKPTREMKGFSLVSFAYFFTLFVLPQYFGVPFPIFDLTVLRIMIVIIILFIFGIRQRQKQFIELTFRASYSKYLFPYLLVLSYTLVLRVDINALLNPLIEIICFFLLIYVIRYSFGIKKTLDYILIFTYIIAFLGLVEYVIQRSPFSYLETISGLYTGRFIRSGNYRIMGPANHSLGYGLILITLIPFICYDMEKDEINILRRKLLLLMTAANILLNGSRSTLGVFILEIFLLALFSKKMNIKRLIIIGGAFLAIFLCFLLIFKNTNIGRYFLLQITSVMDEVLGTTYSLAYGADLKALSSSSNYREQLKYIFQVDWLNPFLGLGRKRSFMSEVNGAFIKSVDNYYIAEYIRYAYPGMICYIVFILQFLIRMLKSSIQKKSQISKTLFVGCLCYCINLYWVDSLQTLKYLYILFAIYVCLPENVKEVQNSGKQENKKHSLYIK